MKYTPVLVGNTVLQHYLQNLLKNGTVPHANLWIGSEHIGKSTFLVNFIMQWFCEQANGSACLKCLSCQQLRRDHNPRVRWITGSGIDEVRESIQYLHDTNLLTGPRCLVIEQADKLTPAASQVLLKVLEEPRSNVYCFLLTDTESAILPTVRSRCATVLFQSVRAKEFAEVWPNSAVLASLSDYLPGQFVQLQIERHKQALDQQVQGWLHVLKAGTYADRVQRGKKLWSEQLSRPELEQHLKIVAAIHQDILCALYTLPNAFRFTDCQDDLVKLAKTLTTPMWLHSQQLLEHYVQAVQHNVNPKFILQNLLVSLYLPL